LDEVEMHLTYDREFRDDCENCEGIDEYTEHIENKIAVSGNLSEGERARLLAVSKHCPIHKMLAGGIEVVDQLTDSPPSDRDHG
jgi:putative redox protein